MAQFKNTICLVALITFCLAYTSALPVPQDETDYRYQNWKDMDHELLAVPSNPEISRVPPPPGFSAENNYNRVRRNAIAFTQLRNAGQVWVPEQFQNPW